MLTLNDSVVEPSGTVTALIRGSTANPPVYLTGAINSATVTVVDDDVAAFTLSASSGEVAEGGTVTLTVTADAITFAEPQTITLTLGGTATPTADFTLSDDGRDLLDPYTLTLPPRARSVTVTVGAAADGETDAGESIEVSAYHDAERYRFGNHHHHRAAAPASHPWRRGRPPPTTPRDGDPGNYLHPQGAR